MNNKLIALIAAACMSAGAIAQTTQQPPTSNSGTSNTGTPTAGQSTANSGEQNATTMQNNSNAQNMAQAKTSKRSKHHKNQTVTDCNQAHTDGNATAPAHATNSSNCKDNQTQTR